MLTPPGVSNHIPVLSRQHLCPRHPGLDARRLSPPPQTSYSVPSTLVVGSCRTILLLYCPIWLSLCCTSRLYEYGICGVGVLGGLYQYCNTPFLGLRDAILPFQWHEHLCASEPNILFTGTSDRSELTSHVPRLTAEIITQVQPVQQG